MAVPVGGIELERNGSDGLNETGTAIGGKRIGRLGGIGGGGGSSEDSNSIASWSSRESLLLLVLGLDCGDRGIVGLRAGRLGLSVACEITGSGEVATAISSSCCIVKARVGIGGGAVRGGRQGIAEESERARTGSISLESKGIAGVGRGEARSGSGEATMTCGILRGAGTGGGTLAVGFVTVAASKGKVEVPGDEGRCEGRGGGARFGAISDEAIIPLAPLLEDTRDNGALGEWVVEKEEGLRGAP